MFGGEMLFYDKSHKDANTMRYIHGFSPKTNRKFPTKTTNHTETIFITYCSRPWHLFNEVARISIICKIISFA